MPDINKMTVAEIQAHLTEKKQEEAKEAKEAALEAIKKLNALGFNYKLAEGKEGEGKGALSDKPCSRCGFRTDPPHDGRKHKFVEGFEKRAFTDRKLTELGLTKLD